MSFIIIKLSLTYYILVVTILFCKFWCENDTLIIGWILPFARFLVCFLILHNKIHRNITMPDHAKISGYNPEAVTKMLKSIQFGLSGHIANRGD